MLAGTAVIAMLAGLTPAAFAQEEAEAESRTLQTITVTSTKREQTLQEIPVAVTVTSADTIEKAQIVDINDLQSVVPSLKVTQLQSSANTNFIIRGFGNGANNAGIEPSVGVFIDGVYRSRTGAQIGDLPSLERVEVLRGPQSTLFGKNASAGVISVVTRRPQFEWGGKAELTLGNYNQIIGRGEITGPLSEQAAFAISGGFNNRDGYFEDKGRDSLSNERDRWNVRGDLLVEPHEDVSLRFIADFEKIDEICCGAANLVDGPTGNAIRGLGGRVISNAPYAFEEALNFDSTTVVENAGFSAQADIDFTGFTLTSISAYRTSEVSQDQDSDFTSADLIQKNLTETSISTITQEIRLTSTGDNRIDWLVGAFFFNEDVGINTDFQYGTDFRGYVNFLTANAITGLEPTLFGVPVNTYGAAGQGPSERMGQKNSAVSLFGQIDINVTDRMVVTLGLNNTTDKKRAYVDQTNTDAFSALDLNLFGSRLVLATLLGGVGVNAGDPAAVGAFAVANPATFAAFQAAAANPANNPLNGLKPLQFLPPFLKFPNSVENGKTEDSETTWTARVAYDVNNNINVYASAATGFKATSWNLSRDSRPFAADLPALTAAGLLVNNLTTGTRYAAPENSTVYEIGFKGAWDRFAVNVAIFDQTIEGFQSNIFTGTGFALANAGEQSTTGIEIDATWTPIDPLTLTFGGTFLDPIYDSFTNSTVGDLSGRAPSGISETSIATSATYTFLIGDNWDAFVRADYAYESEVQVVDNIPGFTREVNLFNASAGFETANGWGVQVWGRNIFNDEHLLSVFPGVAQEGSVNGYPNQPATYGITIRKTF
jgi:outer membrane receptor protein involved in Fe transport